MAKWAKPVRLGISWRGVWVLAVIGGVPLEQIAAAHEPTRALRQALCTSPVQRRGQAGPAAAALGVQSFPAAAGVACLAPQTFLYRPGTLPSSIG